jgi:hypothetical protein
VSAPAAADPGSAAPEQPTARNRPAAVTAIAARRTPRPVTAARGRQPATPTARG